MEFCRAMPGNDIASKWIEVGAGMQVYYSSHRMDGWTDDSKDVNGHLKSVEFDTQWEPTWEHVQRMYLLNKRLDKHSTHTQMHLSESVAPTCPPASSTLATYAKFTILGFRTSLYVYNYFS